MVSIVHPPSLASLFSTLFSPAPPTSTSFGCPLLSLIPIARSCSPDIWDSLLSNSLGHPQRPLEALPPLGGKPQTSPHSHPTQTGRQSSFSWGLQNPRNTFGSVFVKENDTSAGRWYYFGEHFYVQFRVHIPHTAQTAIISLMCVCTVMWSSFRWEQIYTAKSKGNSGSRLLLHSMTINGHAMEGRQPSSPLLLFLPRECSSLKEN